MGNSVNIGNNNKIKDVNIAGNDLSVLEKKEKNGFCKWLDKHFWEIVSAAVTGAVSSLVTWLITFFCMTK